MIKRIIIIIATILTTTALIVLLAEMDRKQDITKPTEEENILPTEEDQKKNLPSEVVELPTSPEEDMEEVMEKTEVTVVLESETIETEEAETKHNTEPEETTKQSTTQKEQTELIETGPNINEGSAGEEEDM